MHIVLWCLLLLLFTVTQAWSIGNTLFNTLPDSNSASTFRIQSRAAWLTEQASREGQSILQGWVYAGGLHSTSVSCTSTAFSTDARTGLGNRVTGGALDGLNGAAVTSPGTAVAINYSTVGANCSNPGSDYAYVAVCALTGNSSGNWTRAAGSNYFVNVTDSVPAVPSDCTPLMEVVITNGALVLVVPSALPFEGVPSGLVGTNLHSGVRSAYAEQLFRDGGMIGPYIVSGCAPAVPSASLTLAAFACAGYVRGTDNELLYVLQSAAVVGPLTAGDGVYWLALHRDTSTPVVGWTRQTGTHYLWQLSATELAYAAGRIIVQKVTVYLGAILAIEDYRIPASYTRTGHFDSTDPLYGAVSGTDSTVALQTAINAARGRCVFTPAGTYIVTARLTYKTIVHTQGACFLGSGMFTTAFDNRVANGPMLEIDGTPAVPTITFQFGVRLEYFSITSTTSPVASDGIWLRAAWFADINHLYIHDITGTALKVSTNGDPDSTQAVRIAYNYFIHINRGIHITGGPSGIGFGLATIDSNIINYSTLTCAEISQTIIVEFKFNALVGCGDYALHVTSATPLSLPPRLLRIIGNEFQGSVLALVKIESGIQINAQDNEWLADTAYKGVFSPPIGLDIGNVVGEAFLGGFMFVNDRWRVIAATTFTAYKVGAAITGGASLGGMVIQNPAFESFPAPSIKYEIASRNVTIIESGKVVLTTPLQTVITSSVALPATYTADMLLGPYHRISTTGTGTLTIAAPVGPIDPGREFILDIFSGTGTTTVAWNAIYTNVYPLHITTSVPRRTLRFFYDADAGNWLATSTPAGQPHAYTGSNSSPGMGSIAAQTTTTFTIAVLGAVAGGTASANPDSSIGVAFVWSSFVSAANVVTVVVANVTVGASTPVDRVWRAVVSVP